MCMYILEGPVNGLGNIYGYYKPNLRVQPGEFVVVENGNYSNGGCGPSLAVNRRFASEADAKRWLDGGGSGMRS